MTNIPPFDPPYVSMIDTPNGVRAVETLADGTKRDLPIDAVRALKRQDTKRSGTSQRDQAELASQRQPAASQKLALGAQRAVLFLTVPYAEKDDAKKMGARWDAAKRKWYVPHGADVNLFTLWWPDELKLEAKALG